MLIDNDDKYDSTSSEDQNDENIDQTSQNKNKNNRNFCTSMRSNRKEISSWLLTQTHGNSTKKSIWRKSRKETKNAEIIKIRPVFLLPEVNL